MGAMKKWIVCSLLALVMVAGCTTKSKSNARFQAAWVAGRQQGMAAQAQGPTVQVVGDVKSHVIPWTDELTLAKALVAAEYQGFGDPSSINVVRNGQPI